MSEPWSERTTLSSRARGKVSHGYLCSDTIQLMKMEENVRKLEAQLKDSFKG